MRRRPRRQEEGSILTLALLISLALLGVGLIVLWASSQGTRVSGNVTRRQEAFYAAESGMAHGRSVLVNAFNLVGNWAAFFNPTCGGVANSAVAGKGQILCDAGTKIESFQVRSGTSDQLGLDQVRYTVYIRNDPIEGTTVDNDRRVILRAEGIGRDGVSYVALQSVVTVAGTVNPSNEYSQEGGGPQGANSGKGTIPD